jgi:hypothetical protein
VPESGLSKLNILDTPAKIAMHPLTFLNSALSSPEGRRRAGRECLNRR